MLHTASQRRPVRVIVTVLTTLLMALGTGLAVTPSAHAAAQAECWTPGNNGEGGGYLNIGVNLKSGPYATGCSNTGTASAGNLVYYQCYTYNSFGNMWWYVRVAGTSTYGWTSAANLSDAWIDDNGDGTMVWYGC